MSGTTAEGNGITAPQQGEDWHQNFRAVASVVTALADGDLSRRVPLDDLNGEARELAEVVNAWAERLNYLHYAFTRLSREIGTEGKFGGQADADGAEGAWKDLILDFNQMAAILTDQVRTLTRTALSLPEAPSGPPPPPQGEMRELFDAVEALTKRDG